MSYISVEIYTRQCCHSNKQYISTQQCW